MARGTADQLRDAWEKQEAKRKKDMHSRLYRQGLKPNVKIKPLDARYYLMSDPQIFSHYVDRAVHSSQFQDPNSYNASTPFGDSCSHVGHISGDVHRGHIQCRDCGRDFHIVEYLEGLRIFIRDHLDRSYLLANSQDSIELKEDQELTLAVLKAITEEKP